MDTIRLVSWNVNGFRALSGKPDWDWFASTDADVVALQETKAEPAQIAEEHRSPEGWNAEWLAAQVKKGYSGVAVFSRQKAALEPEVVDLARFLIACGARIEGHGTSVIRIQGVPRLGGCTYRIMPDRIEAGTLLAAAGITDGELLLTDCPFEELDAVIAKMRQMGMEIEPTADGVLARRSCALRGVDVTTQPFPGFPTDMQAQIMSLMCLSEGSGVISETIFENRFMHVQELVRMGADIRLSGHTAIIRGVQRLAGAPVMASDLRASASLVLAGLAAKGTTTVQRIYHLDRGYEHIENKLNAVGARIRREAE